MISVLGDSLDNELPEAVVGERFGWFTGPTLPRNIFISQLWYAGSPFEQNPARLRILNF